MARLFRYYLRLLTALIQKQKKVIIISLLIGVVVFYFAPKILALIQNAEKQRIGLVGRFTANDLPFEVQNLISNGLTKIDKNDRIFPSIATSWEIVNSEKGYLFHLNENLFWQDGTPVMAKDINYNFNDVATQVLDKYTIQFLLKEPYSPFPAIVSRPVFKKGLIGLGNYRIKSVKKQGQIIEKLVLVSNTASPQKLIYQFYPLEESARTAFMLGEIDLLKKIADSGELKNWPSTKITPEIDNLRYVAIFFNTNDGYLNEKSLRQSLAYSIEKPWSSRALNPINPSSWAYNSSVKKYDFDLENAKKLFSKSQEGIDSPFTEIELATVPSLLSTAETIGNNWQKLGIKTNIKTINEIPENFQALLLAQDIPADPDQYLLWHSTQEITNISHYQNPKIDKLLEDGRKTSDLEKRKAIYFDFQRYLVEETPAIFLYHPELYTIERD